MGKPTGKKKLQARAEKPMKQNKAEKSLKQIDEDTSVFIQMSHELKEEGNRLFQKCDNEGAMLKYEKALKLLPPNHKDVLSLRCNMASCYMQMGIGEYPRAIHECNLALEVAPKYSKALLKRAMCYKALNKFELALKDVRNVLSMDPKNVTALEIQDSVKKAFEEKRLKVEKTEPVLQPEDIEPSALKTVKALKEKLKRRKSNRNEKKGGENVNQSKAEGEEVKENKVEEGKGRKVEKVKRIRNKRIDLVEVNKPKGKVIVEDEKSIEEEKGVTRLVKLVLRDDIRWAQLPINCSIRLVREIIRDRYPGLEGVLIKYKDQEGDLMTITTTAELRLVEASSDPQGSLKLYLVEVSPDKEPHYKDVTSDGFPEANGLIITSVSENENMGKIQEVEKVTTCVEDWIVQFARLFKDHVGYDSDSYVDLYELGMELSSEAIEEIVTTENAQKLFDIAEAKFQEMAALGLFNWGNVHMNKARKWVMFAEDGTNESIQEQVKTGYERAEKEYLNAGIQYEEALKIKSDFFEGFFALGQQLFEQAKLSWCYKLRTKQILEAGPSAQIMVLYNKAEENMEHGMQIWEELEEKRLNGLSLYDKYREDLVNLRLEGFLKDISTDEDAEQTAQLRSQMYILWGTLLYERSIVEFKMGLSAWDESLATSVEKFELAGASPTDLAIIIRNHCSNGTPSEGFGSQIDEIVEAWNEMYDVKRWQTGVPSFRLEPLFRRRVSKVHSIMENA